MGGLHSASALKFWADDYKGNGNDGQVTIMDCHSYCEKKKDGCGCGWLLLQGL